MSQQYVLVQIIKNKVVTSVATIIVIFFNTLSAGKMNRVVRYDYQTKVLILRSYHGQMIYLNLKSSFFQGDLGHSCHLCVCQISTVRTYINSFEL